jgi:hypothetical protein
MMMMSVAATRKAIGALEAERRAADHGGDDGELR